MSVLKTEYKLRKSKVVTNTSTNGGVKGAAPVVYLAQRNIFPQVNEAERTAGLTRYRKVFACFESATDQPGLNVNFFLIFPSNANDRIAIGAGTQTDTQNEITTTAPLWTGTGELNTSLAGGETAVVIDMESNDFEFPPGGYLYISNRKRTGQTIGSGVNIGDSVQEITGTWQKISATNDMTYPKGAYLGTNQVMTVEATTVSEWIPIATNLYEDEDIGDGDGATTNPTLTTLANATNGIMTQAAFLPVVTATCGAVSRTVNVAADGSCSGYCDAGQLNMTTGAWTTPINWTTAPDTATDILITYTEKPYSYSGNTVTVDLASPVANPYTFSKTYAGGCISQDPVETSWDNWVETSTSGTYDETTYPPVMDSIGTIEDEWTIEFTGNQVGGFPEFTVTGTRTGALANGNTGATYSVTNPDFGGPYFSLNLNGWLGSWIAGETIVFQTHPAALPVWLREIVPAGSSAESYNLTLYNTYWE